MRKKEIRQVRNLEKAGALPAPSTILAARVVEDLQACLISRRWRSVTSRADQICIIPAMGKPYLLGYWHMGKSNPSPGWVHPSYMVDASWDPSERDVVIKRLRDGQSFEEYMGYSWCRFYCGCGYEELGVREFTDGTFFWPEGLAHYLEKHAVRLPTEVVDHMLGRKEFKTRHENYWQWVCSKYPKDFPIKPRIAEVRAMPARPKTASGYQPLRPPNGWTQGKVHR